MEKREMNIYDVIRLIEVIIPNPEPKTIEEALKKIGFEGDMDIWDFCCWEWDAGRFWRRLVRICRE